MRIEPATPALTPAAVAAIASAFAVDPLISWFFHDHPQGRDTVAEQFFSLLLRARVALGSPALIARDDARVLGGAMGYTTQHPAWPEPFRGEWAQFESSSAVLASRFATYESLSARSVPSEPHYYLGTIGILAEARGTGVGSALLRAFCKLSADDPQSRGVYLETANPKNVDFYGRHGFAVHGSGQLDEVTLWCLYLAHTR